MNKNEMLQAMDFVINQLTITASRLEDTAFEQLPIMHAIKTAECAGLDCAQSVEILKAVRSSIKETP